MGISNLIKKINVYSVFMVMLIFCVYMYTVNKLYGFTIYPDEFGYWASAAKAVGYDWSAITSLGSYYSFGYSLILIPILFLFKNPVLSYRAAITINMLMMCVSIYLLYQILSKLFREEDKIKKSFICGIAVFYPVWIFYMQMTLTEGLLMFLFVLTLHLFIKNLQKPRAITTFLLALVLIYMYTVHMRTIGIAVACVIILIIKALISRENRKNLLLCLLMMVVFSIIAWLLKNIVIQNVYSNTKRDVFAWNTYSWRLQEFKTVFHFSSILPFVEGFLGKVFYLGMASFGCFYAAMWWCGYKSFQLFQKMKKRQKTEATEWSAAFLLLATIGEVLICNIAMYRGSVIDSIFYGRYDEFLIPALMVVGLCVMFENRHPAILSGIPILASGILIPMILHMIQSEHKDDIRGYFMAGMSYMLKEDELNVTEFLVKAWILGILLSAVIVLVIALCRLKNYYWLMGLIILLEIILGIQISNHYTYKVNGCNFTDLIISDTILEQGAEEDMIYYLDDATNPYIDYIQMQLGNKSIQLATIEEIVDWVPYKNRKEANIFLVTSVSNPYGSMLQERFDKHIKTNTYVLYYNTRGDTGR